MSAKILPTLVLLAGATLWAACGAPTPPSTEAEAPEILPLPLDDPLAVAEVDTLEEEALPQDESLRDKILRLYPGLSGLEELYVHGSEAYNRRDLDLAEEHFFLLKQGLEELSETPQDSLALLYLSSLERKLGWFVDILAEERFFTESYAPFDLSLEDAYDSLQVRYGIPDFLLPELPAGRPGSLEELLALQNERVERWMTWFQGRGRPVFARWLGRHHRYGPVLARILEEEGVPSSLAYLAMIESGLQAGVRSRAGAVGWWQFMRSTARHRGLQVDEWIDERKDIEMATRAAARHLELMHRMFQDWALALAAYNAGEYRIQRAVGLSGEADYWTMRLPRETRDYVPKFIAAARIAQDPARYGFETTTGDTLTYDVLHLDDAYSLDQIAKATGIGVGALRELNPQLLTGVTPPGREDYALRVPVGRAAVARTALARIPEGERITWRKHRVRSGETLGALAGRYNTSVSAIMQINGISNPRRVRAGRVLTIPYPRGVEVAQGATEASTPASGAKTYRVRRGDTLAAISRRTGVPVPELRRRNGIERDRIYPGQTLALGGDAAPAPTGSGTYTVRPGDTLSAISRRLGVNLGDLLRWNDLSHRSKIYPGDRLRLGG